MSCCCKTARNLLLLLLCIGIFWKLPSWCDLATDGFRIARLAGKMEGPGDNPPLSEEKQQELQHILSQPYSYLGSGGQCFAFASEDGRFVLKFFKKRRIKTDPWWRLLPLPQGMRKGMDRKLAKRKRNLNRDLQSYTLAWSQLPEETGIVYMQILPSETPMPQVAIKDKIGIQHSIDLNTYAFMLQKRGELVYNHFSRLMGNHNLEGAKESIHALVAVMVSRSKKGIFDYDAKVHRNFAMADGKALIIDIGSMQKDPSRVYPHVYSSDIVESTRRMRQWLIDNYPELVPTLDSEIACVSQ